MALTREAGAELLLVINGSPYERGQGRHPAGAVRPPRRRRPAARWPTSTWSAARTSWSSTATRWSSTPPARCWPAARSSARTCWSSTSTWPRRTVDAGHPPEGVVHVTLSDRADRAVRRGAGPADAPRLDPVGEVYAALALGLRRLRAQERLPVGAARASPAASTPPLVATIAADALGGENVVGDLQPEPATPAEHSRDDAAELAERLGLDYRVIPIEPMVERVPRRRSKLTGVAEENLQARVRGAGLDGAVATRRATWSWPTATRASCRSGYSTIYGDSVGGFAPIKDVPKTLVWELARWRNAEAVRRGETPPIPESTITKPPSAELRPGQVDQDSLPPYDVLDAILDALRRGRPGPRRAGRGRLRAGGRRQGRRPGRPGRVEAPPVRPRPQDLPPGVRPRPAAAGHQPVARAGLLSRDPHLPVRRPAARPCLTRSPSP